MSAARDFDRMRDRLRAALIERDCMQDSLVPQQIRDQATVKYTRLIDAMVNDLEVLDQRGTLADISLQLHAREAGVRK